MDTYALYMGSDEDHDSANPVNWDHELSAGDVRQAIWERMPIGSLEEGEQFVIRIQLES